MSMAVEMSNVLSSLSSKQSVKDIADISINILGTMANTLAVITTNKCYHEINTNMK
jgi:hypothetical protein